MTSYSIIQTAVTNAHIQFQGGRHNSPSETIQIL